MLNLSNFMCIRLGKVKVSFSGPTLQEGNSKEIIVFLNFFKDMRGSARLAILKKYIYMPNLLNFMCIRLGKVNSSFQWPFTSRGQITFLNEYRKWKDFPPGVTERSTLLSDVLFYIPQVDLSPRLPADSRIHIRKGRGSECVVCKDEQTILNYLSTVIKVRRAMQT